MRPSSCISRTRLILPSCCGGTYALCGDADNAFWAVALSASACLTAAAARVPKACIFSTPSQQCTPQSHMYMGQSSLCFLLADDTVLLCPLAPLRTQRLKWCSASWQMCHCIAGCPWLWSAWLVCKTRIMSHSCCAAASANLLLRTEHLNNDSIAGSFVDRASLGRASAGDNLP